MCDEKKKSVCCPLSFLTIRHVYVFDEMSKSFADVKVSDGKIDTADFYKHLSRWLSCLIF